MGRAFNTKFKSSQKEKKNDHSRTDVKCHII